MAPKQTSFLRSMGLIPNHTKTKHGDLLDEDSKRKITGSDQDSALRAFKYKELFCVKPTLVLQVAQLDPGIHLKSAQFVCFQRATKAEMMLASEPSTDIYRCA